MLNITSSPHMPKGGGFLEDYTWLRMLRKEQAINEKEKPALFLDRDGVVNVEKSFITSPDMIELEKNIHKLIRFYNKKQWPVIIVTNQSAIARGKMNWSTYWLIEDQLIQDLAAQGAFIDLILVSPCHPNGIPPYNGKNLTSRKPAPGMINTAYQLFTIQKKKSIIIGDRIRDIEAGYNGGLGFGIFRNSKHIEGAVEWDNASDNMFNDFKIIKIKEIDEALPIIRQLI